MVRVHFYPIEGKEQNENLLVRDLERKGIELSDRRQKNEDGFVYELSWRPNNPVKTVYRRIQSTAKTHGYEARDRFGDPLVTNFNP